MTISLLTAKAFLAPAAGVVAVGAGVGGTYFVYTNRATSSSSSNNSSQSKTVVTTNTFLARVTKTGTGTSPLTLPLKCTIAVGKEVDCKVFKFTSDQTKNTITAVEKTALTEVTNATTHLLIGNYVFVELTSETVTFDAIKNKNITLKSGTTELTTLDFDQLLVKSTDAANKETYKPIEAITDTYIVTASTPSEVTGEPTITGFRCKYAKGSASNVVDNYDDSCQLFAIPAPENTKHITALSKITETSTAAQTPLTTDTYYKLTVNRQKLYNLDFPRATSALTIEFTDNTNKKTSNLTIHQQWTGTKFIGKTDLLLAKFVSTTTSTYTSTDSKCSFNETSSSDGATEFPCQLHVATPVTGDDITSINITATAAQTSTTLTANHIFAIKLTTAKSVEDLTVGKTIYIHTKPTGTAAVTHKFEIKTLLSGSIATDKKAFIISK